MVCYARRATGILSIAIAALFLFGADTAHLFNVAGLLASLAIVFGGAAVGAAAAFVTLRSVRRRRALAGGCVSCQLRCQHAMTGPEQQRLWLISSAKRESVQPEVGRAPQVFVPLQRLPVRTLPAGAGPAGAGPAGAGPVRAAPVRAVPVPARAVPARAVSLRPVPAGAVRVRALRMRAGDSPRWPDRPTRSTVRSDE
jgi:hypothetical protein